jgi:hypothetical protein
MSRSPRLAVALVAALCACASHAIDEQPSAPVEPAAPFANPRAADSAPDPVRPDANGHLSVTVDAMWVASAGPAAPASPEILAEIDRNAGHLQRCWEARADRTAGNILIHAHVGPDGLVTGQCLSEDTVGDVALASCANEVVAMGRYTATTVEPVDVTFAFTFTRPEQAADRG